MRIQICDYPIPVHGEIMHEEYDPKVIEEKWQKIWKENRTFQADPDHTKQKFMITIPFPYLNGNLHAGHTRTFTIGDVVARYKRMQGRNVLFPMGFHVTGTPIVGLADLVKNRNRQTIEVYRKFHGIPEEKFLTLDEPEKIVDFFKVEAEHDMSIIGYSVDWRRKFTTTSPAFKKFVEWQYKTLEAKGLIVKGSHPVKWCPFDKNPVEDHDILKGEEATIVDYTLIKFRYKDMIFPCATLRPETTYGVTNLWINPEVQYVKALVTKGDLEEYWIVSKECFEKLGYTDHDKVEFIQDMQPEEIIGITLKNPVTDDSVVTLPASFVRPDNGSGVVMSVPAHAPFDFLALRDLTKPEAEEELKKFGLSTEDTKKIRPVSLIEVPEYGEFPAAEIVEQMGIVDQNDEKAEEATKTIYRREFHGGKLKENTGKYHGMAVSGIKDRLTQDFIAQGLAEVFYEFSEPVTCRCGTRCVVNMVRDQWFLNYSDPAWKDKVRKCLASMEIIPEDLRQEFENKIDWLKDKACARRKGLGTKLPCDPRWLIESLGDSTIYMAFYTIAKYVNDGTLVPDMLIPEFFDYIFLGKGSAAEISAKNGLDEGMIEQIRDEFEYWYPVDLRSSGKDLVPNHLLFFLFHHVALFDESKWPKAIAVNGFVSLEGQKMSKSKGPLLTLKTAVSEYGADVTRMYVLSAAEQTQDADWQRTGIEAARKQIERFYTFAQDVMESGCLIPEKGTEMSHIDRWIESRIQNYIKETNEALETIHTRHAVQNAFFLIYNDIKWYHKRGGQRCLKEVIETWTKLMAPFTPHVCEEIWNEFGHETSVAFAPYPVYDPGMVDMHAEVAEDIIEKTMADIEEIRKVAKVTPKRISLYTFPAWKRTVLEKAVALSKEAASKAAEQAADQTGGKKKDGFDMGELIRECMADPVIKAHGKEAQKFIRKTAGDVRGSSAEVAERYLNAAVDEKAILLDAKAFFEKEFGCPVDIYSAEDAEADPACDPQNKCRFAEPSRPAIYMEE